MGKPFVHVSITPMVFQRVDAIADQKARAIIQVVALRLVLHGDGQVVRVDLGLAPNQAPQVFRLSDHSTSFQRLYRPRPATHLPSMAYTFDFVAMYITPRLTTGVPCTVSSMLTRPISLRFLPASKMTISPSSVPM